MKPSPVIASIYSPFGTVLEERNWSAESYRYGFNGKEKDKEGMGGGSQTYDYGFRIYNPALAKFLSVDPRAGEMSGWSPYAAMACNSIIYIDVDGQYPIYFVTRSYAPFKTFGPNLEWYGDDRGHTLDRGASYRTLVSIMHDTELRTTQAYGGHSRSHNLQGTKDAMSPTSVNNRSTDNKVDVHSYGSNAAQYGSPDIDQFTKLTATIEGDIKNDHVLNISGTISGDDFPNQESFVYDTQGTALWLGNYTTTGDREWGPVEELWGEDEGDVSIKINVRIAVSNEGVFQGVYSKDANGNEVVMSPDAWNAQFTK